MEEEEEDQPSASARVKVDTGQPVGLTHIHTHTHTHTLRHLHTFWKLLRVSMFNGTRFGSRRRQVSLFFLVFWGFLFLWRRVPVRWWVSHFGRKEKKNTKWTDFFSLSFQCGAEKLEEGNELGNGSRCDGGAIGVPIERPISEPVRREPLKECPAYRTALSPQPRPETR